MHNPPHTALQKLWNTLLVIFGDADAVSEAESDRDGAFSYAGESHAAVLGFGVALLAVSAGGRRTLAALLVALLWGNRGESSIDPGLSEQLRKEIPYLVGGAVAGFLLGLILPRY